ncbi:MAG: glycosyltransferase family 4 protein [Spirosomataceae bacterium]
MVIQEILFVHRNPNVGFSIQKVFGTITNELSQNRKIENFFLPSQKATLFGILQNGFSARVHCKEKHLIHLTGDSHYLLYFFEKNRISVTVHDVMYYTYLKGWKKKFWKWLYITSLQRARKVIFISEHVKKQVLKEISLDESKLFVIPNPVSPSYKSSFKSFNQQKPRILHIGTLERKNLVNTIHALKDFPCDLRIIGKLDSITISLLERNKIEYSNAHGLSDEEIQREYELCDVVNFPSKLEGFGMPIIEGQAIGRMVITSNISPMKEVAGLGAILVNPFDIESIRAGYNLIMKEIEHRERTIDLGIENVQKYQVDKIAEMYSSVLEEK